MEVPAYILRAAGVTPTGVTLPARESTAWLVRRRTELAVLRRLDPTRWPAAEREALADVAWLHGFLAELSTTGFPAPGR